ncbi:MAG: PAS domain-containing sensor histidine kinase [Planctomycetota bacterium]
MATERKKLESILESMVDGVTITDMQGRIVSVNRATTKQLGYTQEEAIGRTPAEIFLAKEETPKFLAAVREMAVGGTITGQEYICKHKDGTEFPASINLSVLKDTKGKPELTIAVHRDISNRKKAEEALRESEEKYRLVIENARDITYSITPEGTLTFIGPQVANLGYSVDEVVGHNIRDFIHPDDIDHVLRELTQTLAVGDTTRATEFRLRSKDGGYVFVEETGSVVCEGNKVIQITGSIRDVTERKEAEEALRESEQRYKALFEGAAEGILVANVETKLFLYASPAICRMLGYTKEELTQTGVYDIHPKDSLDHVISEFEAQVRGEKALAPNIPCLRKDGTIMYADINTARIVIDGRQCNVGFFTDITERRKAEQALQKAHDELESRVQQRTAQLANAVEELQNEIDERKRAQEQLRHLAKELTLAEERLRRRIAANVHDHIGQNLAISKIKLESLREVASSPKLAAPLDEIRELIAQTIESSRSLTFELSPPVLYELGFEAAVEWLVRDARQKHGLSADFKNDGRPKLLSHDISVLLFQAVRELLVNIAKHAQAQNVTVSTANTGDQIQVTVEDDGIGFDTADTSSGDYRKGAFGLFSIRERLRSIGGRFCVESEPGRGTRVTVAVPADRESKET